jgi:glucosamine--fructose-6-phosphate aminotransferase (isomerizing)
MCGIVGYIGKGDGKSIVLRGLESLEYRGYDSAGIAYVSEGQGELIKQVGRVEKLKTLLNLNKAKPPLVIGHTRWATHGVPSIDNAHPHTNSDKTIFVVHNGIIENYTELSAKLKKDGYKFVSQTDTEVIPHLIDYYYKRLDDFGKAFQAALNDLRGAYAVAAITVNEPKTLYAARLSSPLVIGVGKGEHLLASDPSALLAHTKKVVYLDDYDIAKITPSTLTIHNFKKDKHVTPSVELLDYDNEQVQLGKFPHYMLKEIYEAPATVQSAILGRVLPSQNIVKLGGLENVEPQLKYIDRIVIVACGTSYYAGLLGEYLIEELAHIPVEVQLASEFKYRNEPFSRSTALLAISQSGETADTIAALKKTEDYGVLRLGVVNAVGSTIARMTDAGVYCHAGPEQAVASTKSFIAQVSDGNTKLFKPLLMELENLPSSVLEVLDQDENIKEIALKYKDAKDFLFIGRHYAYPCALEGALKLKEITYIHAEGYSAGEMKHGPLAMIDTNFPTFAIATDGPLLDKTISNIEEIRARKGPVIAIATEGNSSIKKIPDDVIYIPKTMEQTQSILVAVVMQLFSYHIAVAKGLDVDRPRNLAKSVTVE